MHIEKTYLVEAPHEVVWSFLMNIQEAAACIPGCTRCEKNEDGTYSATVKAKVSFITAEFKGKVVLANVQPPDALQVQISGQDSKLASLISAKSQVQLRSISPGETEVSCSMEASVGGRLGALGSSVVLRKTEQMLDQTTENAKQKIREGLEGVQGTPATDVSQV